MSRVSEFIENLSPVAQYIVSNAMNGNDLTNHKIALYACRKKDLYIIQRLEKFGVNLGSAHVELTYASSNDTAISNVILLV